MAFLGGRMIWEFGYRRSKMEKIYRRIRTVYTIANTDTTIEFDAVKDLKSVQEVICID